jgi:spore maturation protein CgeB
LTRSTIPKPILLPVFGGEYLSESALNSLYGQAKIVLNASRTPMSSGLNLRFFEVLGAGALLLSDKAPEIASHFTEGRDVVVFNDVEDLEVKLRNLLANEELREEIAASGFRSVCHSHTYSELAGRLIDACPELRWGCSKLLRYLP